MNEALSHRRRLRYRDRFTLKRGDDYWFYDRHEFAIAILRRPRRAWKERAATSGSKGQARVQRVL